MMTLVVCVCCSSKAEKVLYLSAVFVFSETQDDVILLSKFIFPILRYNCISLKVRQRYDYFLAEALFTTC